MKDVIFASTKTIRRTSSKKRKVNQMNNFEEWVQYQPASVVTDMMCAVLDCPECPLYHFAKGKGIPTTNCNKLYNEWLWAGHEVEERERNE